VAVVAGILIALGYQALTTSAVGGLVATGLIAMAAVLLARPLVQLLSRPLTHVLGTLTGPSGRFGVASLLEHARRTALTVAMVGVGIGSVVWLLTIVHSLERSVVDTLRGFFQADFIVTSSNIV